MQQVTHRTRVNIAHGVTQAPFAGIKNEGATCYLNSLLQSLFMTPELRSALYRWEHTEADVARDMCVPYQLQHLFVSLQTNAGVEGKSKPPASTKALTRSFGWEAADNAQQQDVSELFNVLFESLETTFRGTAAEGVIRSLYLGWQTDYVTCKRCMHDSGKPSSFHEIHITIQPFGGPVIKSVEEGLWRYFNSETLDGDNQYMCERCDMKCDAEKGLKLSKVPYILCLNLKRFAYDWERDKRVKVNESVSFPFELDMLPYLAAADAGGVDDSGDDAALAAVEAAERASAGAARAGFGKDGHAVLARGLSYFKEQEAEAAAAAEPAAAAGLVDAAVSAVGSMAGMVGAAVGVVAAPEPAPEPEPAAAETKADMPYELFAVLIHSGTVRRALINIPREPILASFPVRVRACLGALERSIKLGYSRRHVCVQSVHGVSSTRLLCRRPSAATTTHTSATLRA